MSELRTRLRAAWEGRISGCQLGKPVELLSMTQGADALTRLLEESGALPLRDYVPYVDGSMPAPLAACCRGRIEKAEVDDDINYTVLALLMLEQAGLDFETDQVGRAWLRYLPAGTTFTAERAAYTTLLNRAHEYFSLGAPAGFDVTECADNEFNEWIGAQIRADLYGWVCPGQPERAAELARRDAALSHRGDGIHGAVFVAALGAAIPGAESLGAAIDTALAQIPAGSEAAGAVECGRKLAGNPRGGAEIRARYEALSPVHTVNNLALVVWSLLGNADDFTRAIGEVVEAGLDTDCNGATVGGLWGLQGKAIPRLWTEPWQGRVCTALAGHSELALDDLVERTAVVAERFAV